MGYKLYREVMNYAPLTLTHREKLAALALADDANDDTRMTWNSTEDPEILRQAMVKNERDMRKIVAKLKAEGVIEQVVRGHNGSTAKFRFRRLVPVGATPKPVEIEPPTADEGGSNRTSYGEDQETKGGQNEPPTEGVGGSFKTSRRSKSNTPTPPSPQTSSSSGPRVVKQETSAPPRTQRAESDDEKINTKNPTSTSATDRVTNRCVQQLLRRPQLGFTAEQAHTVVQHLLSGKNIRKPLSYITNIGDEDMRDRLAEAQHTQATRTTKPHTPTGRCHLHHQDQPCIGCAADRKARH